jgi:hypothetical protein
MLVSNTSGLSILLACHPDLQSLLDLLVRKFCRPASPSGLPACLPCQPACLPDLLPDVSSVLLACQHFWPASPPGLKYLLA